MQTQNALELYKQIMDVINQGDDVTIKKDKCGRLIVYRCSIRKYISRELNIKSPN